MKCPVCSHNLVEYNAGKFKVDICRDGCAGIWLDDNELQKCDEHTDPFDSSLLRVKKNADVAIDRNKKRSCPKCAGQTMDRIVLDKEIYFEIDTCPSCKGSWLDIGELEKIRADNKTDSEIQARMQAFEKKLEADMKDPARRHRVAAFVGLLFK